MMKTRTISNVEFEASFGRLHSAIFAGHCGNLKPFAHDWWQVTLLPYGANMSSEDLHALIETARKVGDCEIVVCDVETLDRAQSAIVIETSEEAFRALKHDPEFDLLLLDMHMFGRSARWGCVCAASLDGVAIVGGDDFFIQTFMELAGGIAAVRNRFMQFSNIEWSAGESDRAELMNLAGW